MAEDPALQRLFANIDRIFGGDAPPSPEDWAALKESAPLKAESGESTRASEELLRRARGHLCPPEGDSQERYKGLRRIKDILRINPRDELGIRFLLAQCLFDTGCEEDMGEVLDHYRDDPAPNIRYTRALWTFRREGPSRQANLVLEEALAGNPHVADFLLRRKPLPKVPPALPHPGPEEEAIIYALSARESWQKTLGAIEWLATNTSI